MAIGWGQVESGTQVRLEGALDISVAEELKTALLHTLSSASEVHIDLSGLASIDVTALQLLWAAARESTAGGISLAFDGPIPNCVRSTLQDAGFQEMLAMLDHWPQPRPSSGEVR